MRVEVDVGADPPAVVLAEPADCGRFHVSVKGSVDIAALDRVLRSNAVGNVDSNGEAVVGVDALRRLAAGSVGAKWDDDFGAMLDYGRSKGWLSDDGAAIRAHVEWG